MMFDCGGAYYDINTEVPKAESLFRVLQYKAIPQAQIMMFDCGGAYYDTDTKAIPKAEAKAYFKYCSKKPKAIPKVEAKGKPK